MWNRYLNIADYGNSVNYYSVARTRKRGRMRCDADSEPSMPVVVGDEHGDFVMVAQ